MAVPVTIPAASGLWRPVEWDESLFGLRTARIVPTALSRGQAAAILAEVRAWGAGVVHLLLESDDDASVRVAEEHRFHLVDVRVTLRWRAAEAPPAGPAGVSVRPAAEADRGALEVTARQSYDKSRYYQDPRYPRDRCGDLYARWLSWSLAGGADRVLVAEKEGAAAGYVTCHGKPGEGDGSIGLLGVAPAFRGAGVASALVGAAQAWFRGVPLPGATVVTQARNVEAQKVYERAGFRVHRVQLWYHLWL
jgi:dTDP-4-amino-4,6-dideoxy-D-galactose acyltransferase